MKYEMDCPGTADVMTGPADLCQHGGDIDQAKHVFLSKYAMLTSWSAVRGAWSVVGAMVL